MVDSLAKCTTSKPLQVCIPGLAVEACQRSRFIDVKEWHKIGTRCFEGLSEDPARTYTIALALAQESRTPSHPDR